MPCAPDNAEYEGHLEDECDVHGAAGGRQDSQVPLYEQPEIPLPGPSSDTRSLKRVWRAVEFKLSSSCCLREHQVGSAQNPVILRDLHVSSRFLNHGLQRSFTAAEIEG